MTSSAVVGTYVFYGLLVCCCIPLIVKLLRICFGKYACFKSICGSGNPNDRSHLASVNDIVATSVIFVPDTNDLDDDTHVIEINENEIFPRFNNFGEIYKTISTDIIDINIDDLDIENSIIISESNILPVPKIPEKIEVTAVNFDDSNEISPIEAIPVFDRRMFLQTPDSLENLTPDEIYTLLVMLLSRNGQQSTEPTPSSEIMIADGYDIDNEHADDNSRLSSIPETATVAGLELNQDDDRSESFVQPPISSATPNNVSIQSLRASAGFRSVRIPSISLHSSTTDSNNRIDQTQPQPPSQSLRATVRNIGFPRNSMSISRSSIRGSMGGVPSNSLRLTAASVVPI